MRKIILQLCPPALVTFLKYLRTKLTYAEWEYLEEGWDFESKNLKGWNLSSIVKLQLSKWDKFAKRINAPSSLAVNHEADNYDVPDLISHNLIMSFNYVCYIATEQKHSLQLLDWGSGIGHYGYIAKNSLPGIKVDYWCYDLEAFRGAAIQVMPDIHFYSDIKDFAGQKFDLVNISSSLWYDRNWKNSLEKLGEITGRYLYITRMVFVENTPTYVAIQRPYSMGYKTEYLCYIFNRDELVSHVMSLGFTLEREFYLGPAANIYKAPEQGEYLGFLFKKREG